MTGKLDGKVIVISGGTQGLGEAIARQVVADGAAGLVIAGRSADRGAALAKELGLWLNIGSLARVLQKQNRKNPWVPK